jgi:hypothetical protein
MPTGAAGQMSRLLYCLFVVMPISMLLLHYHKHGNAVITGAAEDTLLAAVTDRQHGPLYTPSSCAYSA